MKYFNFDIIDNHGPNTLSAFLKKRLLEAKEVFIEVAFITQNGLEEFIQIIHQVASNGKVKLITGLYQQFTEPKALSALLDLQKKTKGNFSIRLSKDERFHRKLYVLDSIKKTTIIIGSSNLTKDGLNSSGELNFVFSFPKNNSSLSRLKKLLKREWENGSIPITREMIKKYEKVRKKFPKPKSMNKNQIKKIFNIKANSHRSNKFNETVNFWKDCIVGIASKETKKIISSVTNWDKKNYDWFSTGQRNPYELKDRIFLFDLDANNLALVEVKAITRTPVPTPDGRNFVAYKEIPNLKKKLTKKVWKALKELGINKNNVYERKKLSKSQIDKLTNIIKSK